jgi:CRISPR system Cascade subunit CasC
MSHKKLIIDFHALQVLPPSNVNRDDTGSPKTAIYGGTQRARVSSQSWKKAIRDMFRQHFDESSLGLRTFKIIEVVTQAIIKMDSSLDSATAQKLATAVLKATKLQFKKDESNGKKDAPEVAKALFFLSTFQAQALAELAIDAHRADKEIDKKAAKEALNRRGHAVDIALFGRMVADDPDFNVDASAQVAHSISVHETNNEFDFFTAVDDVKERSLEKTDAGAGMLGTVEFNSSTLYRYATVFTDLLHQELVNDAAITAQAIGEFARAFITSMPTGHQNSFANRTLPSAVLVTIRHDQSVNLVGAFENAIKPEKERSITQTAADQLAQHAQTTYQVFAPPTKSYLLAVGEFSENFTKLGQTVSLNELIENLQNDIKSNFS